MALPLVSSCTLTEAIASAIRRRTDEIVAEEARKAGERTEARVREEVAAIAIRVAEHADIQYRGGSLTISVHVPSTKL